MKSHLLLVFILGIFLNVHRVEASITLSESVVSFLFEDDQPDPSKKPVTPAGNETAPEPVAPEKPAEEIKTITPNQHERPERPQARPRSGARPEIVRPERGARPQGAGRPQGARRPGRK